MIADSIGLGRAVDLGFRDYPGVGVMGMQLLLIWDQKSGKHEGQAQGPFEHQL